MIPLVPAIIPKSLSELRETLEQLSFSSEVHIDVVDGRFVPAVSWPYEPKGEPAMIKNDTDRFTLEVDLMVEEPVGAAEAWLKAGADMLVFHIETISLEALRPFTNLPGLSVGVSLHNHTPLAELWPYLELADYVQLMGIKTIGSQGQPFDETVLERLVQCRERFPHKLMSVDGSVNTETVQRLQEAGAARLIVGSAVTKQSDPSLAHFELSQLIN